MCTFSLREALFDFGSPHAAKEQPEQTAGAAGVEAVKDPKISEAMNDTKAVEAQPVKVGDSEQQVAHHLECIETSTDLLSGCSHLKYQFAGD